LQKKNILKLFILVCVYKFSICEEKTTNAAQQDLFLSSISIFLLTGLEFWFCWCGGSNCTKRNPPKKGRKKKIPNITW